MDSKFPDSFPINDPYNIPIHDQGDKSSCVLHALGNSIESYLSSYFQELTLVDVDDLWDKMLQSGLATKDGTTIESAMRAISIFGFKYKTASGITGVYKTEFQEVSLPSKFSE